MINLPLPNYFVPVSGVLTLSCILTVAATQITCFNLYLRREEIADCLGLTLETVCRQIGALKRRGVIVASGTRRFYVPDIEALRAIAG